MTEARDAVEAERIAGFKNGDMAEAAKRLVDGRGWLLGLLRTAPDEAGTASEPAEARASEDAPDSMSTDPDAYPFAAEYDAKAPGSGPAAPSSDAGCGSGVRHQSSKVRPFSMEPAIDAPVARDFQDSNQEAASVFVSDPDRLTARSLRPAVAWRATSPPNQVDAVGDLTTGTEIGAGKLGSSSLTDR